jgi:hypothetical protein
MKNVSNEVYVPELGRWIFVSVVNFLYDKTFWEIFVKLNCVKIKKGKVVTVH